MIKKCIERILQGVCEAERILYASGKKSKGKCVLNKHEYYCIQHGLSYATQYLRELQNIPSTEFVTDPLENLHIVQTRLADKLQSGSLRAENYPGVADAFLKVTEKIAEYEGFDGEVKYGESEKTKENLKAFVGTD